MRQMWNNDIESNVIGALLLDGDAFDDVTAEGVTADTFFNAKHKIIFAAIASLVDAREPVDVITVVEKLESLQRIDEAGGRAYLAHLSCTVLSADNAAAYARLVVNYSVERSYAYAAQRVMETLQSDAFEDHAERIAQVQQILTIDDRGERVDSMLDFRSALKAMINQIEYKAENPEASGLLTGFQHIDYRTGGMQPGEFHVWAGRPAMGKTAYALNAVRNLVVGQKKNGLIFTLEMPTVQLNQRLVAAEGKVPLGLLKSGKIMTVDEPLSRFSAAYYRLGNAEGQLFFDDNSSLTINELLARAKRLNRKVKLDFIVVDHIGLVDSTLKTDNETLRIGQVSRAFKKLAKELNCVVIGLSQVNRKCEERKDKRPMMSDLRMSGSIEQDADVIQFLYRDEYYNENTDHPNQIEVITAKNRDGEVGTDYLSWQPSYGRIEGMDSAEQRYSKQKDKSEDFV